MNHDAAHCLDYKKDVCPKSCYRAQLTEEYNRCHYSLQTSWCHFKGTRYCPKWRKKEEEKNDG